MDTSERIARALSECFRCLDCERWLPMAQAARDVRWDAERIAGVMCTDSEQDSLQVAEAWPGREVA